MPSIYVKVLGIDADFDEFIVEENHTVQDLKSMVLTAKAGRLIGLNSSDLKVYSGESENTTGLSAERIQTKLASYDESSFIVVPVVGQLSTISKLSGKMTSAILAPKRDIIEPLNVNREFTLVPNLPADSKIRQMLDRTIEVNHNTYTETVAPDMILQPNYGYKSHFASAVQSNSVSFIKPTIQQPTIEYKPFIGTQLSDNSPIKQLFNIATGTYIETPNRPIEIPFDLPVPVPDSNFKPFANITKGIDVPIAGFDMDAKPEIVLHDIAREMGTTAITNALHRMSHANTDSVINTGVTRPPHELIWIAQGTMTTQETFHGHEFKDVESFCTKNLNCFESTRLHNRKKFFIDVDGFTPFDFSRQSFNEIDSTVKRVLYSLFWKTSSILTSSCYKHISQRVGPPGTNLTTTKNKLSYRVIFKQLYGSLEAMDYWLMREILPKLKAELSRVCTVTEQEECEKIQVPDKIPVIILDRWNYYQGDRMRMMGSSKEYENRPMLPIGDVSFMDTVLAYIPEGSFRLPERMQSNGSTRVPIWEPL